MSNTNIATKKAPSQFARESRRIIIGLTLCAMGGYALVSFASLFPLPAG